MQVARVADRVRRMPLHSPVAAVLAGVELVLRRAHDWEQYAHRGVSLKDDLRPLSALVVRWRELELKSWSELLDARERVFVAKVRDRSELPTCLPNDSCSQRWVLVAVTRHRGDVGGNMDSMLCVSPWHKANVRQITCVYSTHPIEI